MSDQIVIWKFNVPLEDHPQIRITDALLVEVLDAKMHGEVPLGQTPSIDIWASVKLSKGSGEYVPIEIRGTGHELGDNVAKHIATLSDRGIYIWHVFLGKDLPPVRS